MLDELLSPLFLATLIATFVFMVFAAWAILSSINSSRRIADSLEELVRKSDRTSEKRESEKEWTFEEPPGGHAQKLDRHWPQPRAPLYIFAFLLLLATPAWSDSPTVQVKSAVDEAIKILGDPKLGGAAKKKERRRLLRNTIFSRFDFTEMARRSLGAHWRRRTPEEQKEFVRVFTDLLERAYVSRIESYTGEKFIYTGERIERDYAEVSSKVLTSKGEEFKIEYRLLRAENEWKIYDVVVEDISLVNNYRSQFNRVISESSFEKLVSRMKQTVLETASN